MYVNGFLCAAELASPAIEPGIHNRYQYSYYKSLALSNNQEDAEPFVRHVVAHLNNPLTKLHFNNIKETDPLKIRNINAQANALSVRLNAVENNNLSYDQRFRLSQAALIWLLNFNADKNGEATMALSSSVSVKTMSFDQTQFSIHAKEARTDIAMANALLTDDINLRIDRLQSIMKVIGNKSEKFMLEPTDLVVARFLKERLNLFNHYGGPRNKELYIGYMDQINPLFSSLFDLHGCQKLGDVFNVLKSLQTTNTSSIESETIPFQV